MQLYQLPHQAQADPGAFVRAGRRAFDAVKALEEPGHLSRCNAYAAVLHGELRLTVPPFEANNDATLESVLERVRDQIEDNFFPHLRVDVYRLRQLRTVDREGKPGAIHRRCEAAGKLSGELAEVGGLETRLRAARLDSREVEERVHELHEAQSTA